MEKKLGKVFVTGATGFVGSYVLHRLLTNGYDRITALKRRGSSRALVRALQDRVSWVDGDIREPFFLYEMVEDSDYVIHTAGIVSFNPTRRDEMFETNVQGTAHVVNACLEAGVKKLIHVSSVAALGRPLGKRQLDETQEWEEAIHNSPYAYSKYLAELEIYRGIGEGLNASLILPATVLGAGDFSKGSIRMFDVVAKGLPFYPTGANGFVDVRDLADICVQMLEYPDNGGRWITCSANISYQALIRKIATRLQVRPPQYALPDRLALAFMAIDKLRSTLTGKPRFFTRDAHKVSSAKCGYLSDKLTQALDFRFIDIDRTISESVEAYKHWKVKGVALPFFAS